MISKLGSSREILGYNDFFVGLVDNGFARLVRTPLRGVVVGEFSRTGDRFDGAVVCFCSDDDEGVGGGGVLLRPDAAAATAAAIASPSRLPPPLVLDRLLSCPFNMNIL